MRVFSLLVLLLLPALSLGQDLEPEDLRRGLVASFADKPDSPAVSRLEPSIALYLAENEAPHPKLGTASGLYRWSGYVNIVRGGDYTFELTLRGKFDLQIGDTKVLSEVASDPKPAKKIIGPVKLVAGIQKIEATFERPAGLAQVLLFWKIPGLQPEPLPAEYLGHLPAKLPATLAADRQQDQGRFLFEESGCVRCHVAGNADAVARTLYQRQGPNLADIGNRVYADWIQNWLLDPKKVRPATNMPKLFAEDETGKAEAYAVTLYLSRLGGGPLKPDGKIPNPKDYINSSKRGEKLFVTTGCISCHQTAPKTEAKEGIYGTLQNYPLKSIGSKTRSDKLGAFINNPHATSPNGRMPNLKLPDEQTQDIARYLSSMTDPAIRLEMPQRTQAPEKALIEGVFEAKELETLTKSPAEKQWLELGKRLVSTKGCANCHNITPEFKPVTFYPAVATLSKATTASGCIAGATPKVPVYGFSAAEKEALVTFVKNGLNGAGSKSTTFDAKVSLRRFYCLNCHQKDTEGGISNELSDEMKKLETAPNIDDVRPPVLTGVGHKLKSSWLKEVLVGSGRVRPWMSLKMPHFGEQNVGFLPVALGAIDGTGTDDTNREIKITPEKIQAGRQMIGTKGFGCISCHDIAGVVGGGTRGPDLSTISQRLRYDWSRRWLEQPLRMSPGTRMPQVFIDGKSLLPSVLGGNPDAQAEAMWAYLSLGQSLPLPEGLEPPKGLVLRVGTEPELLRTFMPEAGNRAIAVGYPGGVNVVFDSVTCRTVYSWAGAFLDASPVWNNRGGAPAKILGPKFWTAPVGNPWAITGSDSPPDFVTRAKDPAYDYPAPDQKLFKGRPGLHFDGYSLDKGGYPTFRYRVMAETDAELKVEERPEPMSGGIASGIRRKFKTTIPANQVAWFFAGETPKAPLLFDPSGAAIKFDSNAEVPVKDVRLALPQDGERGYVLAANPGIGATWKFVPRTGGGWMVMLKLPQTRAASTVELELLLWNLAKLDGDLVKILR